MYYLCNKFGQSVGVIYQQTNNNCNLITFSLSHSLVSVITYHSRFNLASFPDLH